MTGTYTETFVYDKVSRIKEARQYVSGLLKTQSYAYDTFGNLTTIGARTLAVDALTNRISGSGYDAAGSMTSWGDGGTTYSYAYYPTNQMKQMVGDGRTTLHGYSADGERVGTWDSVTGGITYVLRGLDDKPLRQYREYNGGWTWQKDWVYRDGLLLATIETAGTKYFHLDHLGTPRRITNSSRAVIASHDYYPFGEEITASSQDSEALKFTGHERDLRDPTKTTDDLDYMHARFYNPWLGRFLSVDPVGGSPEIQQSWNRYSYVLGNPVNRVDPNGLSSLLFNGTTNSLTLFDRDGSVIGSWTAHNNVQSRNTNGKWEDGTYEMFDTNSPHMHPGVADADTADGSFGEYGIFRARPFTESNGNERVGMGVHSGRESKKDKHKPGRSGTEHATDGCVRTTGAAMAKIAATAETDPLTTITVTDNKSPVPKDTPTQPDDPEEERPQ